MSTHTSRKNLYSLPVISAVVLVVIFPSVALCQKEETPESTASAKPTPAPNISQSDMNRIEYNKLKYEEFDMKRKGGAGLITVSAVLFIPVSIFFFAIYSSGYAPAGFLIIGAAAGIGGIAAIIGGAVKISEGKEGMRRAKNNEFYPVGEQPEVHYSFERKNLAFARSPGLSLSFGF